MSIREFLEYNFINIGGYQLNLVKVGTAILIILALRTALWMLNRFVLRRFFQRHEKVDIGRQYAVKQFVKYLVYVIGALLVLETLGVSVSVIWAGAAALLIGAGLGLQQAVSDFFSGILLLTEGTVEVGDVVVVDGLVGKVRKIGIRTSIVVARDGTAILIPNSKLVMNNVTNWSHNDNTAIFDVRVGVSYDSDIKLVEQLLLQAANSHPDVLKSPSPSVQFVNFGESALDFRLLFYSNQLMSIEGVKSQLRFEIVRLFRENSIAIPFPQRDLWIHESQEGALPIKDRPADAAPPDDLK